MSTVSVILVYLMLWMIVFFISLPIGVNIPDTYIKGNAKSAPLKTNLKIKFLLSTLVTLPITYLIVLIVNNGFLEMLIISADI